MRSFYLIGKVFLVLTLVECKSSSSSLVNGSKNSNVGSDDGIEIPTQPKRIPPQYCRLVGEVIKILETEPGDNCDQGQCNALIKIKTVEGYGSSFTTTFQSGDELVAYFPASLSKSKELPGLDIGDNFKADMESGITIDTGLPTYTIYRYELQ